MKIRPLARRDIPQLIRIYSKIYDKDEVKKSKYYFELSLNKKRLRKGFHYIGYYVAVLNRKVVGVIGEYSWIAHPKHVRWVGYFAVDPKFQSRGIGSKLFKTMEAKAKRDGIKVYCLETSERKEERVANKFYTKMGFKIAGKIPHFWWGYSQVYRYKVLR